MTRFSFADVHRVALYTALATGCASWLPAPAPMRTVANRASPAGQARCLLVLMPGIGDSAEDFADHGFIEAAPWLGEDDVVDEVAKAGGLARWQPPATIGADDYQRGVWRWLKGATEKPATAPPIYLLSGDQDKLARGHRLLGATLPPERRFRIRGTHDWGPWKLPWADFLDHSDFRARCADLRDR